MMGLVKPDRICNPLLMPTQHSCSQTFCAFLTPKLASFVHPASVCVLCISLLTNLFLVDSFKHFWDRLTDHGCEKAALCFPCRHGLLEQLNVPVS